MNNKIDAKVLDKQISKALSEDSNPAILKDLIGISDELVSQIKRDIVCNKEILNCYLYEILIARDKKVLGLKNCETLEIRAKDLKLDEGFENYNAEILEAAEDQGEIIIMKGTDKDGKKNILYYYDVELNNYWVNRQMRIFNQYGDIESMSRQAMFSDGRCEHIDDAVIVYQYDKHGNKKAALYQDDLEGMQYLEYDKAGNLTLRITKDYIMQKVQEGENTYWINEGNIIPYYNGFDFKEHVSMDTLTPENMKKSITGRGSLEFKKMLLDMERKEEVLNILRTVEPVFENCQVGNVMDAENIRKMQKMVTWFPGFAKRLKINPALATQDNAVMGAMRTAIGKTIGDTRKAECDLKTPTKQEIKEKEIGNN